MNCTVLLVLWQPGCCRWLLPFKGSHVCVGVRVLQAHAASVCKVAPRLQAQWVWVSPATAHNISYHSNYATAAKATAAAAATAASVAVRLQLQHLQTATYKRIRIFVRWAVATHALICGAQTAAVLQRKMWEHQRPPPGDEMTGFWKGP